MKKIEKLLIRGHLQATDSLQSSKKRRIYDITNVMEGVGLIRKVSKNTYKVKLIISHNQLDDLKDFDFSGLERLI